MNSSKTIPTICVFLAVTALFARAAQSVAPGPPVFDKSFQGASFSVSVEGTWPTTYQWYRGTEKDPKKVKVAPPEGIQRELIHKAPYVAGWYYCEATNEKGSTLSEPMQLATTKTKSAPKMKLTVRVP